MNDVKKLDWNAHLLSLRCAWLKVITELPLCYAAGLVAVLSDCKQACAVVQCPGGGWNALEVLLLIVSSELTLAVDRQMWSCGLVGVVRLPADPEILFNGEPSYTCPA